MLAHLRRHWGEHAAAVDVLERTLPGSRADLGDRHDTTREILLMLADSASALGDEQAADRWVREGCEAGADLSGDLAQYPEPRHRREAGRLAPGAICCPSGSCIESRPGAGVVQW